MSAGQRRGGPWLGLKFLKVVMWGTYDDTNELMTEDVNEAHVATSLLAGQQASHQARHRVVLDIDMEAELIPSTTPGHYHLYLDHEMAWPQYETLLRALASAGIVEEGYAAASSRRGFSCVRLPWVKKGDPAPAPATRPGEHPCCGGPHTAQARNPRGHAVGCENYGAGADEDGWPF